MKSRTASRLVMSFQCRLATVSFTDSGSKMLAPYLATSLILWDLVLIVPSLNPRFLQSKMKLTKISSNSVALGFS